MVGKRRSGPWYGDERRRVVFEGPARKAYPGLRRDFIGTGENADLRYRVEVDVPGYGARRVEIIFRAKLKQAAPRVYADGPEDSPHRYDDGSLCIWYWRDPSSRRWVPKDGLVSLIDHTLLHLFKEAYWRETDEWLGEEAPHVAQDSRPKREPVRDRR
ncbi:MAG: hypothetical protein KY437_09385 [Actinobacteria bacterium]|nr:hypothetical protein [Actinomycetota bacterium]